MRVQSVDPDRIVIELNRLELRLLGNALNEVRHGVHIDEVEFPTRLGVSIEQADELHDAIRSAYQELRAIS